MIQRGIVWDYGKTVNKLLVRIPYFEKAGDDMAIFECLIAVPSGTIPVYKKKDIVYVDFENNDLNFPVVVSKLFTNNFDYEDNLNSLYSESLKVNGPVLLSADFKVGDITYSDLYYCKKAIQELTGNAELVDRIEVWKNNSTTAPEPETNIIIPQTSIDFRYLVIEYRNFIESESQNFIAKKFIFNAYNYDTSKRFNLTDSNMITSDESNLKVMFYERPFVISTFLDSQGNKRIKINFMTCTYGEIGSDVYEDSDREYLVPMAIYLTNNI